MLFRDKNKIKKRTVRNIDDKTIALARKNRPPSGSQPIFMKILNFLMLAIFISVTAYLLFFSSFLMVARINVSGTQAVDPDLIRGVVKSSLSGKYFGLISKNNLILADKNGLMKSIKDGSKRIEDVTVKKNFPDTLDIFVTERKSSVVICSAGNCFVLDDGGKVSEQADFAADELGENELAVLTDGGNKEISIGDQVLDKNYLQYIAEVKDKLKSDLNLDIDKNYHTPQLVSGDIRVTTSEGWMIYFDESIPVAKEVDTLKLVLDEKINSDQRTDLEYIDLRTENKVYYKFKNSDQQQNQDQSHGQSQAQNQAPTEASSKSKRG